MNYNIATILAVIAIIFVLITYITSAPLVPVAVILLGLAIIFGGRGSGSEVCRVANVFDFAGLIKKQAGQASRAEVVLVTVPACVNSAGQPARS